MNHYINILFLLLFLNFSLYCQENIIINGYIKNQNNEPIPYANIGIVGTNLGTASHQNGFFEISVPISDTVIIGISTLGYERLYDTLIKPIKNITKTYILKTTSMLLPQVEITEQVDIAKGIQRLDPKKAELLPTPGGQVETLIKLMGMGVQSSNELSSQYSVRGGNYDENLVYINDFEIYRPLLTHSSEQEGLSFLNSDLISSIDFSSGGFEAKYGDKMSSVLDATYIRPSDRLTTIQASLLSANISTMGTLLKNKMTYLAGFRYKSNKYLLSTLPTTGDYFPKIFDFQTYLTYQFNDRSELAALGYWNFNQFTFYPKSRETSFGTISEAYKINMYFEGVEKNLYNIWMGGLKWTYITDSNTIFKTIISTYYSDEQEIYDVLSQYWLHTLEIDFESETFGRQGELMGIGSYLNHGRNYLDLQVINLEEKINHKIAKHNIDLGIKGQGNWFDFKMREWIYMDSAGYSLPNIHDSIGYTQPQPYQILNLYEFLHNKKTINTWHITGYIQDMWSKKFIDKGTITTILGFRTGYYSINNTFMFSPRFSISYTPEWQRLMAFRLSLGLYQQPPFWKEMVGWDGTIYDNVPNQKSFHFVLGMEYSFLAWNRPFKFITEAYYKYLYDLVPYVVDNIRIRYLPEQRSKAYATGIDLKLYGEFVPDVDSWISVSIMKTAEDIIGDYYYIYYNSDGERIIPNYISNNIPVDSVKISPGYIPRPGDQRINISLFFQDYVPNNPNFKMSLALQFGSGLPFGPPGNKKYLHINRTSPYRRVDIGFSAKLFTGDSKIAKTLKECWLSLEVLNLLQIRNVASYVWVRDVTDRMYAVPNYLTDRQLNLKLIVKF